MTTFVDPGNVQGNVLRSYGREFNHARYVFLEFVDAGDVWARDKHRLARALDQISFGTPAPRHLRSKDPRVNLAFTYRGLEALGAVPPDMLAAFPEDFQKGAAHRAMKLGDHWQDQSRRRLLQLGRSHLMISFHTHCFDDRDRTHARCRAQCDDLYRGLDLPDPPFHQVHVLDAFLSATRRERFGFSDGFSQPAVEGVDIDAVGRGVYVGTQARSGIRRRIDTVMENVSLSPRPRGWRPIRTGEFLLGYENENGNLPNGPASPLGPDGTFMVYREFDQHVARFNTFVARAATATGLTADQLRAKIVGRWRDGSPATRFPPDDDLDEIVREYACPTCGAGPGRACSGTRSSHLERVDLAVQSKGMRFRANDFHYREDAAGWGCPLGAHVRRTNPRDSLPGGGEQTARHRIIRRGMPFVPGGDRARPSRQGLAFVCLNASIESGFEFIQRNWINNGAAFGLGSAQDFLLQDQERPGHKMVIPGHRPIILDPPARPFVTVRGCEYFFVPSRVACAWLAARLCG